MNPLSIKQDVLTKRGIPLTVEPPVPAQEYAIDRKRGDEWLEACGGEYRKIAEKVYKYVQHLTFADLDRELAVCVKALNQDLAENQITDYAVGLVVGKSTQWVASLATKTLDIMPSSYFSLGSDQGSILSKEHGVVPRQELNVVEIKQKTLVIFDDCSYTGSQIYKNLSEINKALTEKKDLYLVVPFLSEAPNNNFSALTHLTNLNIKCFTSPTKIQNLIEIIPDKADFELFKELAPGTVDPRNGTALCYTDWRFPDETSTVSAILDGFYAVSADGECRLKNKYKLISASSIPRPYALWA